MVLVYVYVYVDINVNSIMKYVNTLIRMVPTTLLATIKVSYSYAS